MRVEHRHNSDLWETPPGFYARLCDIFGSCYHDVAAMGSTRKCDSYYGPDHDLSSMRDGLAVSWPRHAVWMNPPYSDASLWAEKAFHEARHGTRVVALVAARTDTLWWHEYVMRAKTVLFVEGRLRFLVGGKAADSAPFPSVVVHWDGCCWRPEFGAITARGK